MLGGLQLQVLVNLLFLQPKKEMEQKPLETQQASNPEASTFCLSTCYCDLFEDSVACDTVACTVSHFLFRT